MFLHGCRSNGDSRVGMGQPAERSNHGHHSGRDTCAETVGERFIFCRRVPLQIQSTATTSHYTLKPVRLVRKARIIPSNVCHADGEILYRVGDHSWITRIWRTLGYDSTVQHGNPAGVAVWLSGYQHPVFRFWTVHLGVVRMC